MGEMEKDQIDEVKKTNTSKHNKRPILIVAMVAVVAIIAIILISINEYRDAKAKEIVITYDLEDVVVERCEDNEINDFIDGYFKAKVDSNYPKIFASYGRDYYKEEREDSSGSFKKIIDRLKYEKVFIESYDDVVNYTCRGLRDNEVLCITVYDLNLGFTESKAPMILLFYLEKIDDKYVIKNELDVGVSKYIMDVTNTEFVKNLYDDVTERLMVAMERSESLKLAYNSLRQFEVNQNVDLDNLYNNADDIKDIYMLDPVKDADKIYEIIKEDDNRKIAKEKMDQVFKNLIASSSDIK